MTTLLFAIDDRPDLAHTRDKTTSHSFIHSHILYTREWKKKHAFWCSPYLSIRRIMANRLANRRRMRAKKLDRRASKGRWTEKTNVVPSAKWRGQKKAAEDQPASAIQTSFFLLVVLVVGARSYAPRHQSHRLAYQFVVVYVCCGCGGYALCSAKHRAVSKGTVSI